MPKQGAREGKHHGQVIRSSAGAMVCRGVSLPVYVILAVPSSLFAVAAIVAVIRADRGDLPAIVRALTRMGPRNDDSGEGPPSLPKR